MTRIPPHLVHIRQYAMNMVYMPPYAAEETRKAFKRRVYDVLMSKELSTTPCTTDSAKIHRDPIGGRI